LKISIVTINYNNHTGLVKTLESVIFQSYTQIEYIVIDGGSSDGSKEYIENNIHRVNFWISEKDNGVYHAMNKGLKIASGDYVIFMNSGDCFYDENILSNFVCLKPTKDLVYGLSRWKTGLYWNPPREIKLKDTLAKVLLPHQATFYKTSQLKKNNGFKEDFTIISDWGVFIDFILNGYSYDKIDLTICLSEPAGLSQKSSFSLHLQKIRYILKHHSSYIFYYFICIIRDFVNVQLKYYVKPFFKRVFIK
jgi:glycosyltransferase involved in cell wall biosynthesis